MLPLTDNMPSRVSPWITWVLILVNGLVFLHELALPSDELQVFILQFGLVPARLHADPRVAWTLLTSMFLHGGWLHILGNMWFLFVFGRNVEDSMGHGRYLLFYLLCGIAAGATQYEVAKASAMPTIGASGAIAGVLGAYFLLFPRARILTLVPGLLIFPWLVRIPAVIFLGLWFLLQLFEGTLAIGAPDSFQDTAFWAHVGGFCAGMALLPLCRKKRGQGKTPDSL
jgi:membrane associated rhomboid family serine protease